MIVETYPNILIAHATTDDDPQHPNQVLMTSLKDFLALDKARHVAIARPKFLNQAQRIKAAHYAQQQRGRRFILNDKDETHFYCTILILDAIRNQNIAFNPKWQYLDIPIFQGYYLFPEALTHEDVEWVYDSRK